MEVETSTRSRQQTQFRGYNDQFMRSRQMLHHTSQESQRQKDSSEYELIAQSEVLAADDDGASYDEQCNFLGETPCYRTLQEQ